MTRLLPGWRPGTAISAGQAQADDWHNQGTVPCANQIRKRKWLPRNNLRESHS